MSNLKEFGSCKTPVLFSIKQTRGNTVALTVIENAELSTRLIERSTAKFMLQKQNCHLNKFRICQDLGLGNDLGKQDFANGTPKNLMKTYLEFHFKVICTEKGMLTIKEFSTSQNNFFLLHKIFIFKSEAPILNGFNIK